MRTRRGSIAFALAVFLAIAVVATMGWSDERVAIRYVPMTPDQLQLEAGAELYNGLCATCHGFDARGTGPAAPALKAPLPDLTRLAADHGGEFPAIHIMETILGERIVVGHGTREMPVWGSVFRTTTGSPAMARLRAYALLKHIESLQTSD